MNYLVIINEASFLKLTDGTYSIVSSWLDASIFISKVAAIEALDAACRCFECHTNYGLVVAIITP